MWSLLSLSTPRNVGTNVGFWRKVGPKYEETEKGGKNLDLRINSGDLTLEETISRCDGPAFDPMPSWMMSTPTDIVLDFNCNHSKTLYGVLRIEP